MPQTEKAHRLSGQGLWWRLAGPWLSLCPEILQLCWRLYLLAPMKSRSMAQQLSMLEATKPEPPLLAGFLSRSCAIQVPSRRRLQLLQ